MKSLAWFWSHTPRKVSKRKRNSLNIDSSKTNLEKAGSRLSLLRLLSELQGEDESMILFIAVIKVIVMILIFLSVIQEAQIMP